MIWSCAAWGHPRAQRTRSKSDLRRRSAICDRAVRSCTYVASRTPGSGAHNISYLIEDADEHGNHVATNLLSRGSRCLVRSSRGRQDFGQRRIRGCLGEEMQLNVAIEGTMDAIQTLVTFDTGAEVFTGGALIVLELTLSHGQPPA